jgi:hypothetical protein
VKGGLDRLGDDTCADELIVITDTCQHVDGSIRTGEWPA